MLGNLYTVLADTTETKGSYAVFESILQPNGVVPRHVHNDMDEFLYILEGEIEYQMDDETIVAFPGASLFIPRGKSHAFRNLKSEPSKALVWITPAGAEQLFEEVGQRVSPLMPPNLRLGLLGSDRETADLHLFAAASAKYGIEFAA
jgi:quercetin dioxygenase-like cupin family protein